MSASKLSTILIGSTILAVAVVLAAWPADPGPAAPAPRAQRRPVQVAEVLQTSSSRTLRLPGVTRARERAALGFVVPARLAERPVELGDAVHSGQVLARLDEREFRLAERSAAAAVSELQVRLAQARRDRDRVERLAAARAATTEELEQAAAATDALQAAYEAAAAQRDESRRLLSETTLVAPFDGTVTAIHLEPGEWAGPGVPVVELAGSGGVEVRVDVPESARRAVAVGSTAVVVLPLAGSRAVGRVGSLAAAAPISGGLFPAVVELQPSPGVVAGLAAQVVLELESGAALTVPLAAVLDSGSSRPAVFRIADGRAQRLEVVPGELVGDRVTVRAAGLAAGDRVAVTGHTALVDGDPVEVF